MSTDQALPQPPPTDAQGPPAAAAMAALFMAHRVLSESMDRALREVSGLSKAQIEVLVLLANAPGGRLRMADIAQAVCVSRSGTTQIVDRLVAAGLAERAGGNEDRRVIWAEINEAGRAVERNCRPVFDAEAERHLGSRLSAGQIVALHDALRALFEDSAAACAGNERDTPASMS